MAKAISGFLSYVLDDVLGELDGISHRAMFGGYGIYRHGTIFAIVADDQLYFKVGTNNRDAYEAHGSAPFTYQKGDGKQAVMSYWLVPEEIQSDPEQIAEWAKQSLEVSLQSKKKVVSIHK